MELSQEQFDTLKTKGLSDGEIVQLAAQKGYSLPKEKQGIVTSFIKGAAKGFVGDVARPTAQMFQGAGQRFIAAVDPTKNLEEIRAETGLKSLDDSTPEGRSVVESLETEGAAETTGRVAANIASFFIPTSPAVSAGGRALQAGGRVSNRIGIGVSAKEAPLIQAYKAKAPVAQRVLAAIRGENLGRPITNAETALRYNLWGSEKMMGVQARRATTNLWDNIIGPALDRSKVVHSMPGFFDELSQKVDEIPELSRRNELKTALEAFKKDYADVGDVPSKVLQKYKEGWAKFLPDKVYRGKPIASGFRELQNMAAHLARNKIYQAIDDIEGKAAYLDYGNLKNLQQLGQQAEAGSKFKGGFGSMLNAAYHMLITPVASTGGLTLYKLGNGMEFVGQKGQRILGNLFR